MTLRIKMDLGELEKARVGGAVWGHVWLQTADTSFPQEQWWDVIVPVITSWSTALSKIAHGNIKKESVNFMDGPYRVDLSLGDKSAVTALLVKKQLRGDCVVGSAKEDITVLLRNALTVGKELIAECEGRGWADRDTANLFSSIQKVEEALAVVDDSPPK